MTLNQLAMYNLAPRGVKSTCVHTSLMFITGACYQDVDSVVAYEQSHYRVGKGVLTDNLLGNSRRLFGHTFTKIHHFVTVGEFRNFYMSGTYLLRINRHVFVLKDGQYFDLCNTNPRAELLDAWKVEKA